MIQKNDRDNVFVNDIDKKLCGSTASKDIFENLQQKQYLAIYKYLKADIEHLCVAPKFWAE